MRILAIETSCDETAIAIADFSPHPLSAGKFSRKARPTKGEGQIKILSHMVSSQIKLHAKFGGVVPNLAKREHQRNLVPVLLAALRKSRIQNLESGDKKTRANTHILNSRFQMLDSILEREPELLKQFKKRVVPLAPPKIDAIAITYGPGLAPALWMGVNFAKALACLWEKPLMPVNHMAGHLYSAFLQKGGELQAARFPTLALLVSGGHTELVLMRGHGKFKIVGETMDDAAGEAFDKVARILGLKYPGGPEISRLAESYKPSAARTHEITLPRPMINTKGYNFSFSGLKTAVLYLTRDLGAKKTRRLKPLIAGEFQDAVIEVLVKKTIRAAKDFHVKTVLLGGGVASNKLLRQKLSRACKKELSHVTCRMSQVALTGDNALMIALAAYFSGKKKALDKVWADANLRLGS